jgi:excisionase family DNA binding protein
MSIDADPSLGLLTIIEVAKLLRISVSSVRRLQQRRQIPFVKIGGCIRFSKDDLSAYLATRRVQSIDQHKVWQ